MRSLPAHPSLYQINTRVWLTELSKSLGRRATLDDIPDAEIDRLAAMGFDWVWFLSVWQTGPAGQRVSRSNPEWRREFQETLPDLREEDIAGSGFRHHGLHGARQLGGDAALARLRERLREAWPAAAARFRPQPHRLWIIPGSRAIPITTSRAPRSTSPERRRTIRGSSERKEMYCWRTGAILTFRVGRTRCNSTTAIRPRRTQ